MLTTRLLRSARPLSRLLYRHPAAPQRSALSLVRLGQRLYSDSVTNAPPSAQHLSQNTSDSVKAEQPDEPKYSLTFTCKVPECDERTSHMFSKRAYHHGIVIIQCPKCKNRCVPAKRKTVYSCFPDLMVDGPGISLRTTSGGSRTSGRAKAVCGILKIS